MIANLGFFELTLFGIIALIILGPEKLPIAARTVGRWYATFRRASQRLQNEISNELQLLETQEALKKELEQIRESEARMKAQMDALQASLNQNQKASSGAIAQFAQDIGMHPFDSLKFDTKEQVQDGEKSDAQQSTPINNSALPMTNYFFLLGNYDRNRRLPVAPFLPNYTADPLLYHQAIPADKSAISSTTQTE